MDTGIDLIALQRIHDRCQQSHREAFVHKKNENGNSGRNHRKIVQQKERETRKICVLTTEPDIPKQSIDNMFVRTVLAAIVVASNVAHAFSPVPVDRRSSITVTLTTTVLASSSSPENPCWQDLYDEDCTMETLFAANYVAGEWIKKLPCAQGMEVCQDFVHKRHGTG